MWQTEFSRTVHGLVHLIWSLVKTALRLQIGLYLMILQRIRLEKTSTTFFFITHENRFRYVHQPNLVLCLSYTIRVICVSRLIQIIKVHYRTPLAYYSR